jgi:tRNA G18 (ribose-2'-O)-methylase SpoU
MSAAICLKTVRDEQLAQNNSSRNVHDHLKHLDVPELQKISEQDRQPWYTVCLNCTGDLNVGVMIRTSHCLGAAGVIIYGRQRIDNRSLVGAANYIKVIKIADDADLTDPLAFTQVLDEHNLTPVIVEQNGILFNQVNWQIRIEAINRRGKIPALIMGNETGGVPQDFLDACLLLPDSFVVSIPQRGVIRSLNVSVAHGIVAGAMCNSMEWI